MEIKARRYGLSYCELSIIQDDILIKLDANIEDVNILIDGAFDVCGCVKGDIFSTVENIVKTQLHPSDIKELCNKLLNELPK